MRFGFQWVEEKGGRFLCFFCERDTEKGGRACPGRAGKAGEGADWGSPRNRRKAGSLGTRLDEESNEGRMPELGDYFRHLLCVQFDNENEFKRETVDKYKQVFFTHIAPALGYKRLDELTLEDVRRFIKALGRADKRGRRRAKATIYGILAVLRLVLNSAIAEGLIDSHCMMGRENQKRIRNCYRHAKRVHDVERSCLDEEQMRKLLLASREHWADHFCFILVACHTGARLGEMLAFKWTDFDPEKKILRVNRSISTMGIVGSPKSPSSIRGLRLSDFAVNELRIHRGRMLKRFGSELPEWIFPDNDGLVQARWAITKGFHDALRKASLKSIRFHDIRHSFATLRLRQGTPLEAVRKALGHHSAAITLKTYSHCFDSDLEDGVNDLPTIDTETDVSASSAGAVRAIQEQQARSHVKPCYHEGSGKTTFLPNRE
jgi:integrase